MKGKFKYQSDQLKVYWYWINERQHIYLRRVAGKKQPWTKDGILAKYKFTNAFRQLDRVTQEWTTRYHHLLHQGVDHPTILFRCMLFRMFNWPETYDALYFGMRRWRLDKAKEILKQRKDEGKQLFTGAYIISNGNTTRPKYQVISEAVDIAYEYRCELAELIEAHQSMEKACELLKLVPTIGAFVAYEIVCDLRHTRLLHRAKDVLNWANPGPGAKRGIHRLLSGSAQWVGKRPDYNVVMYDLLTRARNGAVGKHVLTCEWPFEMREIEHSLCEFDKYMRVRSGEGRPRSLFKPREVELPPWEE